MTVNSIAVKKNEYYTVDIVGMNHEGQGVARIDNFVIFVDGAIEGEKVEIKIIKVSKSYGVGKLIKIIEPSPSRVKPFCSVYGRCGGCSLQHMSYERQLKFKTDVVREAIKRIGGLQDVCVYNALGMENPLNYRNKVQFPAGMGRNGIAIGFFAPRSHEIVDSTECGIQTPVSDRIRSIVRDFIKERNIGVYDEVAHRGLIRHIMVRSGFKTGEVMVVLVVNGDSLPHSEELVERLVTAVPAIKSVMLNINIKKTNVILGEKNKLLYGQDYITDYIGRYKFKISPLSFFQVNPVQTEVLYSKALEYADLTGNETVFDLYCGTGTISLFLSEKAGRVYGVETVPEAVADARENALLNNVENVEFIVGNAESVVPQLYEKGIKADVVVVDPPRKGCDRELLETLVKMMPERIVYVSCNPSTLARDLGFLSENGFAVNEVQPVDMFPWTPHVECVTLMSRVEK